MATQAVKTEEKAMVAAPAGSVVRQEFGAQQLARSGETAAAAVAAQAQAVVQARYIMALQRPRDWDDVRQRIMREVERPGFAETAWYRKPVGTGVEGFSVRFTDAASRCMGNLLEEAFATYDDANKRVVRVSATDLEANLTKFKDATIEKTVERRSLTDGRVALSMRKNSKNEITYTVPATEDELLGKEAAICSKHRRQLILQILPGDIQDAAKARIQEIRRGATAKDPDGARRRVLDAFATLNVMPSDLKKYLGHDVASASPAEIDDLRDLYGAIASGDATWAEALAEKVGEAPKVDEKPKDLDGLAEKMAGAAPAAPAAGGTAAAPGPAPSVRCKVHPDVDLSNTDSCWKCTAEAKEKAEVAPKTDTPASPARKPGQSRLQE